MRVVPYWLAAWQAAVSDADAHRQRHEHGAAARLALAVSHVEAKLAVVSSRHGPCPLLRAMPTTAKRRIMFGGPSPRLPAWTRQQSGEAARPQRTAASAVHFTRQGPMRRQCARKSSRSRAAGTCHATPPSSSSSKSCGYGTCGRSVCFARARAGAASAPRRQRDRSVIAMARCAQLVQALRLVCRSDSDGGNGTFTELVCQKQILARYPPSARVPLSSHGAHASV